jgi:hypothetical protein
MRAPDSTSASLQEAVCRVRESDRNLSRAEALLREAQTRQQRRLLESVSGQAAMRA